MTYRRLALLILAWGGVLSIALFLIGKRNSGPHGGVKYAEFQYYTRKGWNGLQFAAMQFPEGSFVDGIPAACLPESQTPHYRTRYTDSAGNEGWAAFSTCTKRISSICIANVRIPLPVRLEFLPLLGATLLSGGVWLKHQRIKSSEQGEEPDAG